MKQALYYNRLCSNLRTKNTFNYVQKIQKVYIVALCFVHPHSISERGLHLMSLLSLIITFSLTDTHSDPVSYGRTIQRHITRDEGFLSFPSSAIVSIFGKDVLTTDEGEYWEAEVQNLIGCNSELHLQVLAS